MSVYIVQAGTMVKSRLCSCGWVERPSGAASPDHSYPNGFFVARRGLSGRGGKSGPVLWDRRGGTVSVAETERKRRKSVDPNLVRNWDVDWRAAHPCNGDGCPF